MTAYFVSKGLPLGSIGMQIVHTEIDWKGSVRHVDDVQIAVRTVQAGNTSFTLRFEVFRSDTDKAEVIGRTVYLYVGPEGSGKQPIPDALRAALE